jgi:hypothetical protein
LTYKHAKESGQNLINTSTITTGPLKDFIREFVTTEHDLNLFIIEDEPSKSEVCRQLKKTLKKVNVFVDSSEYRASLRHGLAYRGLISAKHQNFLSTVNESLKLTNDLRLFVYSEELISLNIPQKKQFIRLNYHKNGLFILGVFLNYLCLNKKLVVGLSNIQGLGLFSADHLNKNEVLFKLFGDVVHLPKDARYSFSGEWNALDNNTLLKRSVRTSYGFINHSRHPNCKVDFENLQVQAIKDIKIGEEIFLDYRDEPLPEAYIIEHGASYL